MPRMPSRTCSHCQRLLPFSSFYSCHAQDRQLRIERVCKACKKKAQSSPYAHPMVADNPIPPKMPGICIIGDCVEPVDVAHGNVCVGHHFFYLLSAEANDRCECGNKLVGPYALGRGCCFDCIDPATIETTVTVAWVAGTPTITVVGAVSVSGVSMAG
jgi:hypothetical protein